MRQSWHPRGPRYNNPGQWLVPGVSLSGVLHTAWGRQQGMIVILLGGTTFTTIAVELQFIPEGF